MTRPANTGIELARVVAVVALLPDGDYQVGSGYLITGRLVLTAEHCIRDRARAGGLAHELRVVRASDRAQATGVHVVASSPMAGESKGLDLAVLRLEAAPWEEDMPAPVYARVNRLYSGMLQDCQAIGYPSFQDDAEQRGLAELHGTIYQTELAASGRLVLREPLLSTVTGPLRDGATGAGTTSAWGGLSGALVFRQGWALGVVIEHHPQQGVAAVQLAPFDQLLQNAGVGGGGAAVALALGLTPGTALPVAAAQPVTSLDDLVDVLIAGDLPQVDALNPYVLGATPSDYGDQSTYGATDPYVPRTHNDVEKRLRTSLRPGKLILLTGPSKSGKSRTAFEVLRQGWPTALLIAPQPTVSWNELAEHPRLRTSSESMVVWLDDIHRFLKGNNQLTLGVINALLARPGETTVLGTLRADRIAELRDDSGELNRETRLVLESATTIELAITRDSAEEQAAGRAAYPDQTADGAGLAEELAHAPELLKRYRESQQAQDPLRYLAVRCAVDCARTGVDQPIPESALKELISTVVWNERPDLDVDDDTLEEALRWGRKILPGGGRAALLVTHPLPGRVRGYRPFDYIIAADEGQHGTPRPLPDDFWAQVIERFNPDVASDIAWTAYRRNAITPAIVAYKKAAPAGEPAAMNGLGYLLANRLDPPDLDGARIWYERAAAAGNAMAMNNLGVLLSDQLDPPDLDGARIWYERAAAAGNTNAMNNLGVLAVRRVGSAGSGRRPPLVHQGRRPWRRRRHGGHGKPAV